MSANRPLSAWWALLLLPLGLLIGWLADGLLPHRTTGAPATPAGAVSQVHPPVPVANPDAVPTPETGGEPTPDSSATDTRPPLYSAWTTYDAALEQSRVNGKPVMLDFNAEWCGPCQALKREVFDNPAGGTTVEAAVIPVSITDRVREVGENPADIARLQRQFKVEVFPTLVLFSPATGRVMRSEGYASAEETLRWITEAAIAVR